jgi:hypothetical protein
VGSQGTDEPCGSGSVRRPGLLGERRPFEAGGTGRENRDVARPVLKVLPMESDLDDLFDRLARSSFRRRFRLGAAERGYLEQKGLEAVMSHGEKFIEERLAPADIPNDGKQTPAKSSTRSKGYSTSTWRRDRWRDRQRRT